MNRLRLDENFALREVLDDIVGMVDRREKMIVSASDRAEETRDRGMVEQVMQLEKLMGDFLSLLDPVLAKVRAYGESLRESVGNSEAFLRSLVGVINTGKAIDGSSATVQELEKNADVVEEELHETSKTLNKIEFLLERARQYGDDKPAPKQELSRHEIPSRRELSPRETPPTQDWPSREHPSRQGWSPRAEPLQPSREAKAKQDWPPGTELSQASRKTTTKHEWAPRETPLRQERSSYPTTPDHERSHNETASRQEWPAREEPSDVDRSVEELEDGVSRILREGFLGKENRLSRSDLFGGSRSSSDESSQRDN